MQWIEAHRAHDIDRLVKFPTDDVTIQSDAGVDMPPAKGKEQAQHHWQAIYSTFPRLPDGAGRPVDHVHHEGERRKKGIQR